jgi:hypothetical protein
MDNHDIYGSFREKGFLPIDKEAYPLFKSYDRGEVLLAEMSAAVAVVWASAYNALYKSIHGYLCSVWFFKETVYFEINRPSNPECSLRQLIDELYSLCEDAGLSFLSIYAIDREHLEEFEGIGEYRVKTEHSGDHSEYVYKTADLLELSGGKNYDKRTRLKRCFDTPGISVRPMTGENAGACLEVQDTWCRDRDCPSCSSFVGCEKEAIKTMIDIFDQRIHTGLLLYRDDLPSGYIICEKISPKLAFTYFGKAIMPNFFLYLIYTMFKEYLPGVEYMNLNEDMGNEGLRRFKSHLSVHELWPKYLCTYTK